MYTRIVILVLLLSLMINSLPEKPNFPIKELCELYKEKCERKWRKMNCKQRAAECLDYANNGLRVAWNFCLFMNDNVKTCRERATIDFKIIENAVMDDVFKYDFGD